MEQIGKYRIVRELGKGGMGTVYEGEDTVIGRQVAIKIIKDEIRDDQELKERFFREAKWAGGLSHPNITVVYDVGEHEERPYIVLEYLTGQDLKTLIHRREALTLIQKIDIGLEMLAGLEFAHSKEITHRDIKPDNIRIIDGNHVKIMDFGIARPKTSDLTETGMVMGTPAYMSPEQITGKKLDPRSDIFSFGVVFFELLSYRKPFTGDSTTTLAYQILLYAPHKLNLSEDDQQFLEPLQQLLNKCMKKNVSDRYQSCTEIIQDLKEIRELMVSNRITDRVFLENLKEHSVQTIISRGRKMIDEADFEKARQAFAYALELDPELLEAKEELQGLEDRTQHRKKIQELLSEADTHSIRNDFDRALDTYHKVLDIDPKNEEALQKLDKLQNRLASLTSKAHKTTTSIKRPSKGKYAFIAIGLAAAIIGGAYVLLQSPAPPEDDLFANSEQVADPTNTAAASSETTPPPESDISETTAAHNETPADTTTPGDPANSAPANSDPANSAPANSIAAAGATEEPENPPAATAETTPAKQADDPKELARLISDNEKLLRQIVLQKARTQAVDGAKETKAFRNATALEKRGRDYAAKNTKNELEKAQRTLNQALGAYRTAARTATEAQQKQASAVENLIKQVERARGQVAGTEADRGGLANYREAEILEKQGIQSFQRGQLKQATDALQAAERKFNEAQSDMYRVLNERTAAARKAMQDARFKMNAASRRSEDFTKAQNLANLARDAEKQGKFSRAIKVYEEATAVFEALAQTQAASSKPVTPPTPTPEPSQPKVNPEEQVVAFIETYHNLFESGDISNLSSHMNFSKSERSNWGRFFETAERIQLDILDRDIDLRGTTADVKLKLKLSYYNKASRKSEEREFPFTYRLSQKSGSWKRVK
ncbi:serine/threonine-protein kinase [Acanthopleuribacter pedis]|uniref:Protein kinase n=1 Tax=Acanthopleuribacter pedis TaxID=442870 RepID=A0A8J7QME0_9BACT|nr:serine/threonine-protein kinase [Acanthopleuribacter pedis]MBO1322145.1 protein kinase [Acanthopleuribacter pedis]